MVPPKVLWRGAPSGSASASRPRGARRPRCTAPRGRAAGGKGRAVHRAKRRDRRLAEPPSQAVCFEPRSAPTVPETTALRMRGKFLSARQRIGQLPPVCSETGPRPPIRAARSCKRDRRGCSPGHAPTQWAQAKISPGFSKRKSHQTSQAMKAGLGKRKAAYSSGDRS